MPRRKSRRNARQRGRRTGLLVGIAAVCAVAGFGFLKIRNRPGSPAETGAGEAENTALAHEVGHEIDANTNLTPAQAAEVRRLRAIGYVGASDPAPAQRGVIVHDAKRAWESLNLCVSAHAPEATLMDMDGTVLHTWACEFRRAFPNLDVPAEEPGRHSFRRAQVLGNGDLLAIYEGIGLIKLDKHSQVIWAFPGHAHHDLFVTEEGYIYVLTRKLKFFPRFNKDEPLLEDFITLLSPEGQVIREVSVLRALANSKCSPFMKGMRRSGDVFHTNTLEILDGRFADRSSIFKAGNALISILYLNLIAIVDLDEEMVVWAARGPWRLQHQPTMLDDGNMLLFDNTGNNGKSQVLEIDPMTLEVRWSYQGPPDRGLFSALCGSVQRLPNGNTLITESHPGRALEVTPGKEIVWEYVNPHSAGKNDELITKLWEVVRLPRNFPLDWLNQP